MLPGKQTFKTWLVPYVEGTLDARREALLTAEIARDPALAAEADTLRAVAIRLHQSAVSQAADTDPRLALDPSPLWPEIEKRLTAPRRKRVMASRTFAWAGGLCVAVVVIAGLFLHGALFVPRTPQRAPFVSSKLAAGETDNPKPRALPVKHHHPHGSGKPLIAQRAKHLRSPHAPRPLEAQKTVSPSADDTQSLPTSPASVPRMRPAVSITDGETHFRLASPVHQPATEQGDSRASEQDSRRQHRSPALSPDIKPRPSPPPAST